jgi:hypothetical protein
MIAVCFNFLQFYPTEIETIIGDLPELTELQKRILQIRYVNIIKHYQRRVYYISLYFNLMRFIVTVGSLIVPALLSIQTPGASDATNSLVPMTTIYWSTWTVSLAVTMSNGILTLFKMDKKYYSLNTVLEHLRSEGWQYLQLTGRYSGHLGDHIHKPSHKNQFVFFTNMIEKIVMRQVEDEYYKVNDSSSQGPPPASASASASASSGGSTANPSVAEGFSGSIHPPSPADQAKLLSPVKEEVSNTNREWVSGAEPVLKTKNNAQERQKKEHSSADTIVLTIDSVQQQETNPNTDPSDGPKMPQFVDLITVSPTQ